MCIEPPLPFAIPPFLPVDLKWKRAGIRKLRWKENRITVCISTSTMNEAKNYLVTETVTMSQHCRLTGELSHDLLHSPSSGVSVAVGAVRSDQVVCQINRCFNTNRTGFLKGKNKQLEMLVALTTLKIIPTTDHQLWSNIWYRVAFQSSFYFNSINYSSDTLPILLLYSLGKIIADSTWPSYKWQNPLMIFCLYSWSAFSSIRLMVCMVR